MQETYGKSGCRRVVPGQFVTVDPKGRACLISAVEKQKFVYVLNRDSAANLTISSPLEAHKSHNLTFSVVGLDVGFDNPTFAAIELDYAETDQVGWRGGGGDHWLRRIALKEIRQVDEMHTTPSLIGHHYMVNM